MVVKRIALSTVLFCAVITLPFQARGIDLSIGLGGGLDVDLRPVGEKPNERDETIRFVGPVTLSAGFSWTPIYQLMLELQYQAPNGGLFSIQNRFHLTGEASTFRPFLLAGLGIGVVMMPMDHGVAFAGGGHLSLGAGLKYRISEAVLLGIEARLRVSFPHGSDYLTPSLVTFIEF